MAQTTAVSPVVTVQNLAPQLVAFSGSQANFQNLVNGLVSGAPVQLQTVLPNGFTQAVTFTPTVTLSALQAAQILESTRQQLIGLGIGAPTAEQIAFALMGGVVPTALGGAQVNGQLNAAAANNPPSVAAQIQAQSAASGTTAAEPSSTATGAQTANPRVTGSVNVTTTPNTGLNAAAGASLPRTNLSDSAIAAGATSRSPTVFTSASPAVNTSASPGASGPLQSPGLGSAPIATERVPPNARPARN